MFGFLFQGWCIPLRLSSGGSLSSKKGSMHWSWKINNETSFTFLRVMSECTLPSGLVIWLIFWFWSKGSSQKAVQRKPETYAIINASRWVMTFWTKADLKHSNGMADSNYAPWITHRLNRLSFITSYRSKSPKEFIAYYLIGLLWPQLYLYCDRADLLSL